MFWTIVVRFCAVLACFLFGVGFAAGAAKAAHNQDWNEFGCSVMLTICFSMGIWYVMHLSLC